MKELQLWLASALLCSALMAQSPDDRPVSNTSPETNSAFSFFTVTAQNGRAVLKWSAPPARSEDFFIVEKSLDAEHFEMLSAIDASTGLDSVYSMEDNSVGGGTVSYRIRIAGKDGRDLFSKIVNLNSAPVADFKFYPNPVDKLLIIRTSHNIDIQISDALGTLRMSKQLQPGLQVVNISTLEKGSYVLKVADKESNRIVSEQLLKN